MADYGEKMSQLQWGGSGNQLSKKRLMMLQQLYYSAINQEASWDRQCWEILVSMNLLDKEHKTYGQQEHGYYIKTLYNKMYQPSSTPSSRYMPQTNLDATLLKDGSTLINSLLQIYPRWIGKNGTIQDIGALAVYKSLKKNVKNADTHFALGNYGELKVLEGLAKGIQDFTNSQKKNKNSVITNANVIDSDVQDYSYQVKYDIGLDIDYTYNTKMNNLHLPIEVKSGRNGVQKDYLTSQFHFGEVSDTAFTFDRKNGIYEELIDSLQKSFQHYVTSGELSDRLIRKHMHQMMIDLAIQFIQWKLSNNFPLFVSDTLYNINLSSEIIKGFMNNPGGTVEYILYDIFSFVDLGINSSNNNIRYVTSVYDDTKRMQAYNTNWLTGERNWEDIKAYNKTTKDILSRTRITPRFKAHIWYGK